MPSKGGSKPGARFPSPGGGHPYSQLGTDNKNAL